MRALFEERAWQSHSSVFLWIKAVKKQIAPLGLWITTRRKYLYGASSFCKERAG
jgi:hypothetical protein